MISCTIQIIFFFSPYASKFMLVSVHSKKFLNYFSRISFFLSLHEIVHIALFQVNQNIAEDNKFS